MISQHNEITINEILASTKMLLRIANTTEHDDLLELTAREAIRHIGSWSIFKKKQCCLTVCEDELNVKLPKDFYKLFAARTSVNGNCNNLWHVDKKFLSESGCSTSDTNIVDMSEGFQMNNEYLHFNSDLGVDEVTIAYLAFNTDKEGNIKIYEHYERAIKEYLQYTFKTMFAEKFKEATIDRHYRIWKNQKAWIKGVDANIDFLNNKREIQELFLSLIAGRNNNF